MATRFTEALQNFKFPKEIKNDLIYCQRALRTHLKVHQMIVEKYLKDKDFLPSRQAFLDELETEIYEINCEQQYLLLRLRRVVDEFFKSLQREDIGVDRILMNDYISRQLVPLIQNKDYVCVPSMIRVRYTESQLIHIFFIPGKGGSFDEFPASPIVTPEITQVSPETQSYLSAKQVSLLKPISERVAKPAIVRQKSVPEIIIPDDDKPTPPADPVLPVSSKVKLSRLNLRQALSKAAAAINTPPPQAIAPHHSIAPQALTQPKVFKLAEAPTRKSLPKPVKSDPSSSDESLDARVPSPPQLGFKTKPHDYNQETFLRLFNLFTKEHMIQMQQRRSKRKRRTVHNNEKADFHYGRIDHVLSPQPTTSKKRKKEFLLSPRVSRTFKKKRSPDTDRSNSSSPDEKARCNECLKSTGVVIQCKDCPSSYHEKCHKDANIKPSVGQCPSCSKKQTITAQHDEDKNKMSSAALEGQIQDLELKLIMEQERRLKLQAEGKMYKIGMRNLIDIVQKIKKE